MADLSLVYCGALEPGDDRAANRDELAPVLAVRRLDPLLDLALQRVETRLELGDALACGAQLVLELEDALHAGERHAVVGELLDALQQRDVAVGVAAAAPARAAAARSGPCARRCAASAGARPRARPRPR